MFDKKHWDRNAITSFTQYVVGIIIETDEQKYFFKRSEERIKMMS